LKKHFFHSFITRRSAPRGYTERLKGFEMIYRHFYNSASHALRGHFNKRPVILYLVLIFAAQFLLPQFYATASPDNEKSRQVRPAHAGRNLSGVHLKWPHEKSALKPDPALKFGRLANGFRYVLLLNKEPKDRVSIHLNIRAGSLNEKDDEQGAAHFIEHLLFCGTTHFEPGELVEYFQSIGMQFGPDANARTGFNETSYDILLPVGDRRQIDRALVVMKDFAKGALLLPEEIDRERKVVLAEKRTRDSSSYRTFVSTLAFEFPDAKLSRRLPIGKEAVLNAMDRSVLKSFYDTWYRPDHMVLVMVGDFDTHTAETLIREKFTSLTNGSKMAPEPDFGNISHKGLSAFYHFENEAGSTSVSIETIKKIPAEPDSLALEKKRFVQEMANRIVRYRLNDLLKKPGAPFTSAAIHSGTFLKQIEYSQISAECNPENWLRALSIIEQTLRQTLVHGFTGAECERAKQEMLTDLENAVKSASTRNSKKLAGQILSSVNRDRVMMSPKQEKELYSPVIQSLFPADLHQALRLTWNDEHLLVLVTGNAELPETPEARIINAFNESLLRDVDPPEEKAPVVFPYLDMPEQQGKILQRSSAKDLDLVQIDFENNVRLNLKKTDFKANSVRILVSFGAGKSSQPFDKPGLSDLAKEVVNESGLGALGREDLDRTLSGKKTTVSFDAREDSFRFLADTTPDELDLAFQLLYSHLVDPGFRKEAFRLAMKRFNQEYKTLDHSIEGAMALYGKPFLAGEDTRFGLPPRNRFNRLNLEDVISWLSPMFAKAPLEVSVVGDFNMDTVVKSVSKSLGAITKRHPLKNEMGSTSPVFPHKKTLALNIETKVPKGLVVVAYPTSDIWDIHLTRRLAVLSQVLSERLRKQIREKIGASYSPYAYNHPSRAYTDYGVLYAFIRTDPSLTDQVVSEVYTLSEELAASGVDPEELRLALDPILTDIKDLMSQNHYWLNTVLAGSKDHPLQLDWSRSIVDDYSSITTEEVSALAAKYLDPERAAVIVISSEKKEKSGTRP
jgi:zinc protease